MYTFEGHFIRDFHLVDDKLLKEFFGFTGCFVVQLTGSIELHITAYDTCIYNQGRQPSNIFVFR